MPLVAENHIYDLCDGSYFIRASVHIEHGDGMLESPSSQPVLLHIVVVHELASGSAVYGCGPGFDLCSISGLYFYLDDQGLRARGCCYHISFWKVFLLSAEVEWSVQS